MHRINKPIATSRTNIYPYTRDIQHKKLCIHRPIPHPFVKSVSLYFDFNTGERLLYINNLLLGTIGPIYINNSLSPILKSQELPIHILLIHNLLIPITIPPNFKKDSLLFNQRCQMLCKTSKTDYLQKSEITIIERHKIDMKRSLFIQLKNMIPPDLISQLVNIHLTRIHYMNVENLNTFDGNTYTILINEYSAIQETNVLDQALDELKIMLQCESKGFNEVFFPLDDLMKLYKDNTQAHSNINWNTVTVSTQSADTKVTYISKHRWCFFKSPKKSIPQSFGPAIRCLIIYNNINIAAIQLHMDILNVTNILHN